MKANRKYNIKKAKKNEFSKTQVLLKSKEEIKENLINLKYDKLNIEYIQKEVRCVFKNVEPLNFEDSLVESIDKSFTEVNFLSNGFMMNTSYFLMSFVYGHDSLAIEKENGITTICIYNDFNQLNDYMPNKHHLKTSFIEDLSINEFYSINISHNYLSGDESTLCILGMVSDIVNEEDNLKIVWDFKNEINISQKAYATTIHNYNAVVCEYENNTMKVVSNPLKTIDITRNEDLKIDLSKLNGKIINTSKDLSSFNEFQQSTSKPEFIIAEIDIPGPD